MSPGEMDVDAVIVYAGEVWTDARGYATVRLPEAVQTPAAPLEYLLRDLDGDAEVRLKAELEDGRFTIETDEPHVKVAWQVAARRPEEETCPPG